MCVGGGLLWAWDAIDRRRMLSEVMGESMGLTVLPDGTKVFDLFQEPLRDELDRCSGTVVSLSILAGTPFVRFRSALPKALLSGDMGEVLGRRNGLSATQAKRTQPKEDEMLRQLYGVAGACSGICADQTAEIEKRSQMRKKRAVARLALLNEIFESTRARALHEDGGEEECGEDHSHAGGASTAAAAKSVSAAPGSSWAVPEKQEAHTPTRGATVTAVGATVSGHTVSNRSIELVEGGADPNMDSLTVRSEGGGEGGSAGVTAGELESHPAPPGPASAAGPPTLHRWSSSNSVSFKKKRAGKLRKVAGEIGMLPRTSSLGEVGGGGAVAEEAGVLADLSVRRRSPRGL